MNLSPCKLWVQGNEAREMEMFQNEEIAKEAADRVRVDLIRRGASPWLASRRAEKVRTAKLRELDEWTAKNVGLN